MSRGNNTLRSIYRDIEEGLYRDLQEERNIPDEDMDMADEMAFAHWELQLASRTSQNYDSDIPGPAIGRATEEELSSQVAFFTGLQTRKDEKIEEFNECGHTKSGQAGITIHSTLPLRRPSSTKGWRSWVDKLERLNKKSEEKIQRYGLLGSERLIKSFDRSDGGHYRANHYEILYNLLVSKAVCPATKHSALLKLQSLSQSPPHTLDMYLSCPPGEPIQKHRASIMIKRPKQTRKRPDEVLRHECMDICQEIRTLYRDLCRRLYLIFDESGIQLAKDPRLEILPPHPGPRTVCLSDLLQKGIMETEDRSMICKKSSLALDLAFSVHQMYGGPWIQHKLDARVIELLCEKELTLDVDFKYACIPCELVKDWRATNKVWQESQTDLGKDSSSSFFLSLAELLVDISLGKKWKPPLGRGLRESLIEEANKMMQDRFLRRYGEAVLGCVQFPLNYKLTRRHSTSKDSTAIAREAIFDYIVKNLSTHLQFWEEQSCGQVGGRDASSQEATKSLKADKFPHKKLSSLKYRKTGEMPAPFFTLWASGDDIHEKMNMKSDSQAEFQKLMKEFHDQFIIPSRDQNHLSDVETIRPPAVVIAVLDSGLCIDDSDMILWSGCDKRLRREHSRNYLSSKGDWAGWDRDSQGHGTHVVRILLEYTVSAEIIVLKVADSRKMDYTPKNLENLLQALTWAGEHADIINLSIGLDEAARGVMQGVIRDIILKKGKLIFAAASNSGGNGVRAYPAKERGVFAIHATKGNGTSPDEDMNPPAKSGLGVDNFATLGCKIPTRWKGEKVFVSGTSFATPVAAAIAANALEFARLAPIKNPEYFSSYQGMRSMLRQMSSKAGNYDYIRPWKEGMFRNERSVQEMQEKLQEISILHENE